jgi:hypothetical protein
MSSSSGVAPLDYSKWIRTLYDLESFGGKNVVNPESGTFGPYQFKKETYNGIAKRLGLPLYEGGNPPSLGNQKKAYEAGYYKDTLKALNRANVPQEKAGTFAYVSHKYGQGAVDDLYNAYLNDSQKPMSELLTKLYGKRYGEKAVKQNRLQGKTVADEIGRLSQKFGESPNFNENPDINFGYDAEGNEMDHFANNMLDSLNRPEGPAPADDGVTRFTPVKNNKEWDEFLNGLNLMQMGEQMQNGDYPGFAGGGDVESDAPMSYKEWLKRDTRDKPKITLGSIFDPNPEPTYVPGGYNPLADNDIRVPINPRVGMGEILSKERQIALPMNIINDELVVKRNPVDYGRPGREGLQYLVKEGPWKDNFGASNPGETPLDTGFRLAATPGALAASAVTGIGGLLGEAADSVINFPLNVSTPWNEILGGEAKPATKKLAPVDPSMQTAIDMVLAEENGQTAPATQPPAGPPAAPAAEEDGSYSATGFKKIYDQVAGMLPANPMDEAYKNSVNKLLGRVDKDREMNKWMSIATAGFNMMGGAEGEAPFFGNAVRRGTNAGLANYNQGNAEIAKQEMQGIAGLGDLAKMQEDRQNKTLQIAGGIYEKVLDGQTRKVLAQTQQKIAATYGSSLSNEAVKMAIASAEREVGIGKEELVKLPPAERILREKEFNLVVQKNLLTLSGNKYDLGLADAQKGLPTQ